MLGPLCACVASTMYSSTAVAGKVTEYVGPTYIFCAGLRSLETKKSSTSSKQPRLIAAVCFSLSLSHCIASPGGSFFFALTASDIGGPKTQQGQLSPTTVGCRVSCFTLNNAKCGTEKDRA